MASAKARRRNVLGAFKVPERARWREAAFLLVDDVLTTGATAEACARALKRAGAARVHAPGAGPRCPGLRTCLYKLLLDRVSRNCHEARHHLHHPICPYCARAKSLLKQEGRAPYEEVDVLMDEEARDEMEAKSGGARTVPQIFIGDTHVGGCDELYALEKEGKLDRLLS